MQRINIHACNRNVFDFIPKYLSLVYYKNIIYQKKMFLLFFEHCFLCFILNINFLKKCIYKL